MHPGHGCTVVQRGLIITHEGFVVPCWHYTWDRQDIQRSMHERSLDAIVDAPEVIAELKQAAGPEGCTGCSTMCYNWDETFREKVMTPSGTLKFRRSKEHFKQRYPGVTELYRRLRYGNR